VAGRDPRRDARWFERYCPIQNVTRDYPPTLLAHGDADTDVPHQRSVDMAERLRQAGVAHEFVSLAGGSHGIGNLSAEERERVYRRAAEFLKARV
jgi:dipeptidyl aminopeptidase/acylaminoacyl peptidase